MPPAAAFPRGLWPVVAAWALCTAIAIFGRGVIPVDETRYLSVAWEMWLRGDLLVPHVNGEPYSHKPPLLFWAINVAWWLFGASEAAARSVVALLGLGALLLVYPLARLLWPARPRVAVLAPWILLTVTVWLFWTGALMFDLLLAACAELGLLGILLAWRGRAASGWLLAATGIGLGILAKGPAVLVFVLPAALLAPLWARAERPASWIRWYLGALLALLGGAAIGLAWALPAAQAGGQAYADAILWGQTAGRVATGAAPHARPFWWYLPLLPVLLFPWSTWAPLWRSMRWRLGHGLDDGARLALSVVLPGLLIFSLISGKQVHYLLPLMPAFALFAAYSHAGRGSPQGTPETAQLLVLVALPLFIGLYILIAPQVELPGDVPRGLHHPAPWWSLGFFALVGLALLRPGWTGTPAGVGGLSIVTLLLCYGTFVRPMAQAYDMRPIAAAIAGVQAAGGDVGFTGRKYSAQFNFPGRLQRPVDVFDADAEPAWRAAHPQAGLVRVVRERPAADRLFTPVWNKARYHLWIPPGGTD